MACCVGGEIMLTSSPKNGQEASGDQAAGASWKAENKN